MTAKRISPYLKALLLVLCCSLGASGQIQTQDTLMLTRQQYEELFLKQNLLLMAKKTGISQAEALVRQAKLWPNPNISLEDVNLWTTSKQLSQLDEPLPPIFGSSARNTQFVLTLEQEINTAGKRRKQIKVEQTGVEMALADFDLLLRQLKLDFNNKLTELGYVQQNQALYAQQYEMVGTLLHAYRRQLASNHISKADYVRLQSLQLQLSQDLSSLTRDRNEIEAGLKVFLSLDTDAALGVIDQDLAPNIATLDFYSLLELKQEDISHRPDLRLAQLGKKQQENQLAVERAQSIPDVTLSASYDHGGGIWPKFYGFGISFNLPFFDRNQGAIAAAQYAVEEADLEFRDLQVQAKAEVLQNFKDLKAALDFYQNIGPDFEIELDGIFQAYTKNFRNRNISLLQYLDFQEAYLDNKKIILEAQKDLRVYWETLQYSLGKEL